MVRLSGWGFIIPASGTQVTSHSSRPRTDPLAGTTAAHDEPRSRQQYLQIQQQRPVADVFNIKTHHVFEIQFASPFDLPQAGDPRVYAGPLFGPVRETAAHTIRIEVLVR